MSKKSLRSRADKLWKEKAIDYWGRKCCLCNNIADDCHHFYPKSGYAQVRYEISNAVPLCRSHHNLIHRTNRRKEIEDRIILKRGKKWYDDLRTKANKEMGGSWKTKEWYKKKIKHLKEL